MSNTSKGFSAAPCFTDTGTTLILLATDAFQAYKNAAGATLDNNTSLLTVTEAQFRQLPSLFFQIGDVGIKLC